MTASIDSLQRLHDMQTEPGYDDREPSDADYARIDAMVDADAADALLESLNEDGAGQLIVLYRLCVVARWIKDTQKAANAGHVIAERLVSLISDHVDFDRLTERAWRRIESERESLARDERNADREL